MKPNFFCSFSSVTNARSLTEHCSPSHQRAANEYWVSMVPTPRRARPEAVFYSVPGNKSFPSKLSTLNERKPLAKFDSPNERKNQK
jgi:hypothetical protein